MFLGIYFDPKLDLDGLRTTLDTAGHADRVRALRALRPRELAQLFEASKDGGTVTLDHFVPPGTDALKEVIHHGGNTLPLFSQFQKRFCRPDGAEAEAEKPVLWGYNEGSTRPFVGPGYFVARDADDGEVVIDYGAVPPRHPEGWPEILPNKAKLGRFVWVGMTDYLRKVSEHVSIGRAFRGGKPMDQWFVLCREDPPA